MCGKRWNYHYRTCCAHCISRRRVDSFLDRRSFLQHTDASFCTPQFFGRVFARTWCPDQICYPQSPSLVCLQEGNAFLGCTWWPFVTYLSLGGFRISRSFHPIKVRNTSHYSAALRSFARQRISAGQNIIERCISGGRCSHGRRWSRRSRSVEGWGTYY